MKIHLTHLSGLDPDSEAFDSSGNLTTFCGRWTAPLNNQKIQLTAYPGDTTCKACQRTKRFHRVYHFGRRTW